MDTTQGEIVNTPKQPERKWWKEAIVYQIYPLSFKDSNTDGKGDLQGIISKLDYLKSIGIDVVWLNPIFKSPNDDNGYDISDYENIMQDFGSMQDFDILLKGLHERGIKLILDLVVNHTSDEHPWFKESRSSRTNPYRNYYHWWPVEKGTPPKRISDFDENKSAWKYDEITDAYYLHYFSPHQPDLNWENKDMRNDFYKMMHFWLDKGIDGFRIDAVSYISKDRSFPEVDWTLYKDQFDYYYQSGKYLHTYLHEMYKEVFAHYDIMTVGEGATFLKVLDFTDPKREELNLIYAGYTPIISDSAEKTGVSFDLCQFKQFNTNLYNQYGDEGWPCIILGNHDLPRIVSTFGNDSDEYRAVSSKLLITYMLSMRGTPYWYMGDEIGMTNIYFENINDYNDIATKSGYQYIRNSKGEKAAKLFLKEQKLIGRDNSRTPIQWDKTKNAGFTKGKPWLKINSNYKQGVNVSDEEKNKNSILNYFKVAVKIRKENIAFIYGSYTLLEENNPQLYIYLRKFQDQELLVILNFSCKAIKYHTSVDIDSSEIVLHNYGYQIDYKEEGINLRPYESIIFRLE